MAYCFMRYPEGKAKAVTLSYDDGCVQDVRFLEAISRHGLKGTFNLNSARLLKGQSLTVQQARELVIGQGHEVAVHGDQHLSLGHVRAIDGIRDVLVCREQLEQTFGQIIRGMAYADSGVRSFTEGGCYQQVRTYLQDMGIVYARSLGGDNDQFRLPEDWYNWIPTAHHTNTKLEAYMEKFRALDVDAQRPCNRFPRLFYLWGHSYEFDNNDNWALAETVGKTLGGKADTWYATNIEIHDYVEAYRHLHRSADGRLFYNPGVIPVWFTVVKSMEEADLYCIQPGQTLEIQ